MLEIHGSTTHRYVLSRDVMFNEVSHYYPSQVISFKNINHNNESDICSKTMIESLLSSNACMYFDSSSFSFIFASIISSSSMVEQSDKRSNDVYEEKILILRTSKRKIKLAPYI